jgi:hypothetical protein
MWDTKPLEGDCNRVKFITLHKKSTDIEIVSNIDRFNKNRRNPMLLKGFVH